MKNNTPKKRKVICGVGINDANYTVNKIYNGKAVICPFYSTWTRMLQRCYGKEYQKKYPTYIGCTTDSEWLVFSNFKSWMSTQDWEGNALDKDILIQGNKVYSSLTCIFVSASINNLLVSHQSRRGNYPLGVSLQKTNGKYQSNCHAHGKIKFLGYYNSPEEAHEVYKAFKYKHIAEVANQQSEPLRTALLNYVIEG
jgi:hypothetical protein